MFEYQIRVGWGHCDPANIAYTARLPEFSLEAIDAWWEDRVGADWFKMNRDQNLGTPFVGLSMDFRSPVTPRHPLVCKVLPTKLGRTSVTFRVEGWQNDMLCFEGAFTEVFIVADVFTTRQPPDDIRALLEKEVAANAT